jgi:hypothetical protein
MRGHVVGIQGDFSAYGYGVVKELTHAYTLVRDMTAVKTSTEPVASSKTDTTTMRAINPLAAAAQAQREAQATEKSDAVNPMRENLAKPETTTPITKEAETKFKKPDGPATAIVNTQSAANTRSGPSTVGFDRVVAIPRGTRLVILEAQTENRAQRLRWFKVNHQGQQVWLREDLCTTDGDTESLSIAWDAYPAPMGDNRWWVRDFNLQPNFDDSTFEHWGWDLGAPAGEPIRCGPFGGVVVASFECAKCTPARPSTVMNGLRLGDTSVLSDPGWGFGYGHYVIVGYSHDLLPPSTQALLAQKGYPGGSIFVMHAHLQERTVSEGQRLNEAATIGLCGNSGNSEATHLHLEVRASKSDQFAGWAALRQGLMTPGVLFKR